MKVFIKSSPEHAKLVGNRLLLANDEVADPNADATLFDFNEDDLQVSFNEPEFSVNPAEAERRKKCAIDNLNEVLASGEQLQSHVFGATIASIGQLHAGCPVLKATTNLAEYLVVYDNFVVANGTIKNNTIAYGNYKPKPPVLKNAIVLFLAQEFGKALAKKGAEELYNKFFPEDKDAVLKQELKKVKDELIELLKEIKYENLEDKLIATRGWLRDIYSEKVNSYNNKETQNMEEIRLDLKGRQEEIYAAAEIIQQRILDTDLASCDYTTRSKVMLYTTFVSLRIVILKEQIFWQNVMLAQGNKNYANTADLNELRKYVSKVSEKIKDYSTKLKKGRLEKISDFSHTTQKHFKQNKVGWGYKHFATIKWNDKFESSNKNDPFRGEKIESFRSLNTDEKDNNVEQIKADMERDRTNHFNDVVGLFSKHVEDPINDVLSKLANNVLEIK